MAGLGELFIDARKEWTADVIGIVTDRFERRLTDETSKLRLDIAGLRQDWLRDLRPCDRRWPICGLSF